MKIFKLLSILLVLGLIFSVPAMAKMQDNGIDVPDLNIEKIKNTVVPEIIYMVGGQNATTNKKIADLYADRGVPSIVLYCYKIDTNGDGTKDLWYMERKIPAGFRLPDGTNCPPYTEKLIFININENGTSWDRVLIDAKKKNGELGFDGYYEYQKIMGNNV